MYIRHMIREGGMCPLSGIVFETSENSKTKDEKNKLNPKDCPHKKSQGTCNLLKLPCERDEDKQFKIAELRKKHIAKESIK